MPSPACSLRGESDESLKHLFLSCHYTKNLWSKVIKWLVDHIVKIENLSDKDILSWTLGCENEIFVNHILLLAKQCLYSCGQNKYSPSIRVVYSKINNVFLIQTMTAQSNNKLKTHNMKRSKYQIYQISIRSFRRLLHLLLIFFFFTCKQKIRYWGFLFPFCQYVIVCQCTMYICLVFFSIFCIFPTCSHVSV